MAKRVFAVLALLLLPGLCQAQEQEKVLPSGSQLYFRWDGIKAHRAAFDKTAAGKMMKGEMGTFLRALLTYGQDVGQLVAQKEPQVGPWITDATKIVGSLYRDGVLFGIEVEQVNPPKIDAVFVFPKGAGKDGAVLPLLQKAAEAGMAEMKEQKVGQRSVKQMRVEMVQLGWWAEGNDAVLYIGTREPSAYVAAIDAGKTGLAKNPLYRRVRDFKEFTHCTRGYVDMNSITKIAGGVMPNVPNFLDALGLRSMSSITFVSGFDGPAERSVVEVDTPGTRKGLLNLASRKKFALKDLPKLPADITGFSAGNVDVSKSYDAIVQLVEAGARLFAPEQADNIKEMVKQFEGIINVNIKDELLSQFDDLIVSYSSSSEGPLGLGGVVALKVKDSAKLNKAIEKLVKAVPPLPNIEVVLKRHNYKGSEIVELSLKGQTNSNIATFGFCKGWFVYASYPLSVKGFILRQNGELPAWRPSAEVTKILAEFPKEYTALTITDPRPTLKFLLSVTPTVLNLSNSLLGQVLPGVRPFDLDLIPHPELATRGLFPNVAVTTDDGKKIRTATRGSLALP